MSVLKDVESRLDELLKTWPEATAEITTFDSGAVLLDVKFMNRLFVLNCAPNGTFGVDEVSDDTGFDMYFRFGSQDLGDAWNELLRLLETVKT